MSSNKHARVVTSSALFDHHPVAFAASQPTPNAAAIGASFQSPTIETLVAELTAVPEASVAATVIESGAVTTGAVTSATVSVAVAVAVSLPSQLL